MRLIILFIVQVRIENTIFRIAVCKRSKVVQDALIEVAGCRRENIIDWRSHWVLAYIRTFNQKLLLTTLGVQNFLSAVLFHRSCTFSFGAARSALSCLGGTGESSWSKEET